MKIGFIRFLRSLLMLAGLAFVLQLVIGVFGIPGRWSLWLSGEDLQLAKPPQTIVILGGGGIPSASGLLRTYYGARAAEENRRATCIVSLPAYGDPETGSVGRMRDELVMRGVPARRIWMEHAAFNTHEQAVNIRQMLGERALNDPLLVVTCSYHVRRAVLCFKKQGFSNVGGRAAHNVAAEDDLGPDALRNQPLPVTAGLNLRYGFWHNLEYSIRFIRELVALTAYRLRGWI